MDGLALRFEPEPAPSLLFGRNSVVSDVPHDLTLTETGVFVYVKAEICWRDLSLALLWQILAEGIIFRIPRLAFA